MKYLAYPLGKTRYAKPLVVRYSEALKIASKDHAPEAKVAERMSRMALTKEQNRNGSIDVITRSQVYDARSKKMCIGFWSIFIGDLRSNEAAKALKDARAYLSIEKIIVKGRFSSYSAKKNLRNTDDIARNAG